MPRGKNAGRAGAHRHLKLTAYEGVWEALRAGARTRREVQKRTGLSWAWTSRAVNALVELGVLTADRGEAPSPVDGRRPEVLAAAGDRELTAAVEWGPRAAEWVAMDLGGRIVQRGSWPLPEPLDNARARRFAGEAVKRLADACGAGAVRRLHFVLTGAVDEPRRLWLQSPHHPGIKGLAFEAMARAHPEVEVVLEHDVTARAREAARESAGAAGSDYVFFTFDHGIGMAVCEDGRFLRGCRGMAGEIGHLPGRGRIPCSCGRVGCLETEMLPETIARECRLRCAARAGGEIVWDALTPAEERRMEAYARERFFSLWLTAAQLFDPPLVLAGGGALLPRWQAEWAKAWPAFIKEKGWAKPATRLAFYSARPGMGAVGSARSGIAALSRRRLPELL